MNAVATQSLQAAVKLALPEKLEAFVAAECNPTSGAADAIRSVLASDDLNQFQKFWNEYTELHKACCVIELID